MAVKTRIPVELYFDEELGTWHFHIDEPRISGGGQASREEARAAAAEAVAFALSGSGRPSPDTDIEFLDVALDA